MRSVSHRGSRGERTVLARGRVPRRDPDVPASLTPSTALGFSDEAMPGTSTRRMGLTQAMPTTRFMVHTSLSPGGVLTVLTDFGPDRASRWPNIDEAHFTVHEVGPDWAEVTEGTAMGWERERYSWDAAEGTVTIETLDSNLWGPGVGWRYELVPADGGTDVRVTLARAPTSLRGRLVGALIPILGARTLGRQLRSVLERAESGS
jgi:hypothetical protein